MLRALIVVLLLIDAAMVYAILRSMPSQELVTVPLAIAWAALIILVAIGVALGKARALALAQGIALSMVLVAVLFLVLGTFSLQISGGGGSGAERTQLQGVVAVAVLMQLVILGAAHVLSGAKIGGGVANAVGGFFAMWIVGWAVAALIYVVTPFADFAMTAPRFEADSVMRESVVRVQACAHQYHTRNPTRGYPPDLRSMGPDPSGSGCLPARFASGRPGRARVEYVAAAPDATGAIPSFTVTARVDKGPKGLPIAAFGDTSGVLRAGRDSVAPPSLRVEHGALHVIRNIRACAEIFRQRSATGSYPRALADLQSVTATPGGKADSLALLGCTPTNYARWNTRGIGTTTRLDFAPIVGSDPVTDYAVDYRPHIYAVDGIRGYRATARGPVRVTKDDRPATDSDPVVPPCEYELGDHVCAPLPGGIAPEVALDLDTSAFFGVPFRVAVRDLRPPSRRDAAYQATIECSHRPYTDSARPPREFNFVLERECVLNTDTPRQWSDRALVRAWVRDRAGSVVVLIDTVRVGQPVIGLR
jgi:hypothetical protein